MTQMPAFCGSIELFRLKYLVMLVWPENVVGQLKEIWLWSYFFDGGLFIFRAAGNHRVSHIAVST